MLKINKSELKTNKILITQVTNSLFYKLDKKQMTASGLHISPYARINKTKQNKSNIKNISKNYISLAFINKKHKIKVTLIIEIKIICILLPCKWLKPVPFFLSVFFILS